MNLTAKLRAHIISEFKAGKSMAEIDRVFLQKPGTVERLVREAMVKSDKASEPGEETSETKNT